MKPNLILLPQLLPVIYIHLYSSNDSNQRMLTNEKTNNDNNNNNNNNNNSKIQFPYVSSLVVYISARLWLSAHKTLVYDIRISQGSAATRLRCGGNINNTFIAHCLQSAPVEELLKLANIWQR